MPWTARDATRFTKRAATAKLRRQWARVANSAESRCRADGGSEASCSSAAIRQANAVVARTSASNEGGDMPENLFFAQATLDTSMREEVLGGDLHIVRPIKIVRPMVLRGLNSGPVGQLLPAEEIIKCPPGAWNNSPLSLGHPFVQQDGKLVFNTADTPEMVGAFGIGTIFGTHIDEQTRVSAEAWLNAQICEDKGGNALRALNLFKDPNQTTEVSSGYVCRLDPVTGEFGGVAYNGIHRDIHPDHVAILLDSRGACSNEHGCGLGINCAGDDCTGHASNAGAGKRTWRGFVAALETYFGGADDEGSPQVVAAEHGQAISINAVSINKEKTVETVETIKTVVQLNASPTIDEGLKVQLNAALAFQEAEMAKQAEARKGRIAALVQNEHAPFELADVPELEKITDAMLEKFETLAANKGKEEKPAETAKTPTSFAANGMPASMLTKSREGNKFVPVGNTIPALK